MVHAFHLFNWGDDLCPHGFGASPCHDYPVRPLSHLALKRGIIAW
jgi:hypothetical protein